MTDLDLTRLRQQAQDATPGLGRLTSAIPVRPATIRVRRLRPAHHLAMRHPPSTRHHHRKDPTMSIQPEIAVRLVKVNVNCGDHAQDIVQSVAVRPDETITEAAARLLTRSSHWGFDEACAEYDWRLEVQLVRPADDDSEA